jgi:hypothetical protein
VRLSEKVVFWALHKRCTPDLAARRINPVFALQNLALALVGEGFIAQTRMCQRFMGNGSPMWRVRACC